MRKTVAALVAALLGIMVAATLAGCSSDSSSSSAPTASAAPAPAAASTTAAAGDLAVKPQTALRAFPAVTTATAPPAVIDVLGNRPMLLVFFDSSQAVTRDMRTVVSALGKKFGGRIEIEAFDLAAVRKAAEGSKTYKAGILAVVLAQKLGVGYMPAMVVVSADKRITWQSSGYYDDGTLEREIMRVAQ